MLTNQNNTNSNGSVCCSLGNAIHSSMASRERGRNTLTAQITERIGDFFVCSSGDTVEKGFSAHNSSKCEKPHSMFRKRSQQRKYKYVNINFRCNRSINVFYLFWFCNHIIYKCEFICTVASTSISCTVKWINVAVCCCVCRQLHAYFIFNTNYSFK